MAAEWKQKLDDLAAANPGAYVHRAVIYPDKGHWMDREDAEAVPWMAGFTRQKTPARVVWQTAPGRPGRFYWLAAEKPLTEASTLVDAMIEGERIRIIRSSHARELTLLLDDSLVNLEQPVEVVQGENVLFRGKARRTISGLSRSLSERADPRTMWPARLTVNVAVGE